MRVLDFYVKHYSLATRMEWKERISSGLVLVNNKEIESPITVLHRDDVVTYNKPPWEEEDVPTHWKVLFEDDHIVAINKPSGLPVLPGGGYLENTLLSMVRRVYPDIAPIHRLGRGTCGIVICARSAIARSRLTEALRNGKFTKIYRTLVQGTILLDEFQIHTPIGKIPHFDQGTLLFAATPEGKASESHCRVLYRDMHKNQSLVQVQILTGRPHQIRIHMAAAGYPLVDDPLYTIGGIPTRKEKVGDRLVLPGDCGYFLCAHEISFPHPTSGKQMTLVANLPDELKTPNERAECV